MEVSEALELWENFLNKVRKDADWLAEETGIIVHITHNLLEQPDLNDKLTGFTQSFHSGEVKIWKKQ